jgi:hypothetical protein
MRDEFPAESPEEVARIRSWIDSGVNLLKNAVIKPKAY